MAIDTYDKKRRALNFAFGAHNLIMPEYDGSMDSTDKIHLLNKYQDFDSLVVNGQIHYAVEIFLPGINIDDSSIGLVDDPEFGHSVLRFVTDRPQYDGVTVVPTWEDTTANTKVWHEGILIDGEMGNPNRNIDLSSSGEYGTLSGMNFSVSCAMVAGSTSPFWKTCQNYNIIFFNRIVKMYVIIEDVFFQAWQGVVTSTPYNETNFKFVCKSDFKTVHKSIPPIMISDTNYPDAISDSKGKPIPVCLGKVPYAQMLNINGSAQEIALVKNSQDVEFNTAQALYYYVTNENCYVVLKTPRKIFGEVANDLGGKYLIAVAGGGSPDKARCYRITNSRTVWESIPDPDDWYTYIYLAEPLDNVDAATFNANYVYGSAVFTDVWQFKVVEIGRTNIVSNDIISEFKPDFAGRIQLFDYISDEKRYRDIRNQAYSGEIGTPTTLETASSLFDVEGTVKQISPIRAEVQSAGYTYESSQTVTTGGGGLTDLDRSTGGWITGIRAAPPADNYYIQHDVDFILDVSSPDFNMEKLWLSADFEYLVSTIPAITDIKLFINYELEDQYGNTAVSVVKEIPFPQGYSGNGTNTWRMIPNDYYVNNGNDNGENSDFHLDYNGAGWIGKTELEFSESTVELIRQGVLNKRLSAHVKANVNVLFMSAIELHHTLTLNEIGLFGVVNVDSIGTALYTRVNGEVQGVDNSDTVYSAFRRLLIGYDGLSCGEWTSSEDVDLTNLQGYRHNAAGERWDLGFQLRSRKNSFDYYSDLCAASFCAMFQNRRGQKVVTAWRQRTDNKHPKHDQDLILRDSIKSFEKTQAADTFNDFLIEYNYDPGEDKCNRSIFITKVDQAAFPAEGSLDANGNPTWWQYVGGLSSYSVAKSIWESLAAIYVQMKTINQFKASLSWFPDLRIYENDPSETDGVEQDSSAYRFLQNCLESVTVERAIVQYSIALNKTNIQCELCDPIVFNDPIYTDGVDRNGWIQAISINTQDDLMEITAILEPVPVGD